MSKTCPLCGGELTKEVGAINEPVIENGTLAIRRVSRPAVFYACGACEHCEEVGGATAFAETGVCGNCGDDVDFDSHDRDACGRAS